MWKSEFDVPSSNAILLTYTHPFAQGPCLSRITRVGSINMHARLTCHITSTGPIPTNRRVPSCAPSHPWVGSNTSPIAPVAARRTPARILTRPHMVTSFIRARNEGRRRAFRRWLAHRAGIKGRAPSPTRRERHGNPACHAPRLTVPFQPYLARCGATEHFLFTNTYVHGLRLTISLLSLFFATKYYCVSFMPMNTHTHRQLSSAIIHEEHNCTV